MIWAMTWLMPTSTPVPGFGERLALDTETGRDELALLGPSLRGWIYRSLTRPATYRLLLMSEAPLKLRSEVLAWRGRPRRPGLAPIVEAAQDVDRGFFFIRYEISGASLEEELASTDRETRLRAAAQTAQAMTGWWQSVVPPPPFAQRAVFWAGVWLGVALFTGGLAVAGLAPSLVLWGLAGAGLMVGVFGYLQRTRMGRFWDEIGRHWDRAGETRITFGPDGVEIADRVSHRRLDWDGIDAVRAVQGGTVIRSGISMIVVPDAALEMEPPALRAQLAAWRQA